MPVSLYLVPIFKPFMISIVPNVVYLSFQDSPEQGVLYLTRGLLNVIQTYPWDPQSCARATVYLHVLDMLSTAAQEVYPYHIDMGKC